MDVDGHGRRRRGGRSKSGSEPIQGPRPEQDLLSRTQSASWQGTRELQIDVVEEWADDGSDCAQGGSSGSGLRPSLMLRRLPNIVKEAEPVHLVAARGRTGGIDLYNG